MMKEQIKVRGLILAQSPVGEYDRRVVILTLEKGKISAFARGAKKPNSMLSGVSQPMTFGTFTLYPGKNSYTLLSVEVENYFAELKKDLLKVAYGTYFLELASYLTRENNDERQILKLLYQSLRVMEKGTVPLKLVRCIYEIRLLTCFGEGMQVFQCSMCGSEEELTHFSALRGGVICNKCWRHAIDSVWLVDSSLYTLQFIISTPIEKVFSFVVSDKVLERLMRISREFLNRHLQGEFKSLEMLDVLES